MKNYDCKELQILKVLAEVRGDFVSIEDMYNGAMEEGAEFIVECSKKKRGRVDNKDLVKEMGDLLAEYTLIMHRAEIDLYDIVEYILHKTETKHPEQWERLQCALQ